MSMDKPDIMTLYARYGAQSAEYINEYCLERGGYQATCPHCGTLLVISWPPTRRDPAPLCGACAPALLGPWRAGTGDNQDG